ncbi:MAG: YfhO family protein [Planctomycetota bacterium]|nr:YfhO family protein [Planctomycetota bacterium]
MLAEPAAPSARQQWQAVLLAALCALLFLRGGLLPGNALVPYPPEGYDLYQAEALATGTYDAADAMRGNVSMGDKYNQSLCWDRIMQDRFGAFDLPLWTKDIGGGASFVPQMAQVYQPINLLLFVLPSEQWYGWWYLLSMTAFGWLCYRFLRRVSCQHLSALLGVVCAVLGLWTQCKLHHNVVLTAALSLWPMLSSIHAIARSGDRSCGRAMGWLGLWTGLTWMSGFAVVSLQVSYLAVGFAVLLCLQNERGQRWRPFLRIGIGMALGGLLSLCHMVPVLLASAESSRGASVDLAALAANGLEWDYGLTAFWPDLLSWGSSRFYPSDGVEPFVTRMPWSQLVLLEDPLFGGRAIHSWVETSFAIGGAATACAVLALGDRERRGIAWFFAGFALIAFGFATADQPFLTIARFVPGIASADLRRLLFSVAMGLVVLAALGADRILRQPRPWLAIGTLGLVAAVSLIGLLSLPGGNPDGAFVDRVAGWIAADGDHELVQQLAQGDPDRIAQWIRQASQKGADGSNLEAADNLQALHTTALRTLLFAVFAALALTLRSPRLRVLALIAGTALELLHTGLGPVQTVPAERVTTPPALVAPVLAAEPEVAGVRPRMQRLASPAEARANALYPPNMAAFHGIEDACAYNPLPSLRMEQFFTAIEPDREGKTNVAYGGAGVGPFHDPASLSHPLCDLFGIRFILTDQPVAAIPTPPTLIDRSTLVAEPFRLLERTTTLPRATFVQRIEVEPDPQARLQLLSDAERDVANVTVLEDPSAPVPTEQPGANTEVRITTHDEERVVVEVQSDTDGYLRLADPYDPGWTATIDGEPTPLYPADHYLRAVYVPAGAHEVVFTFDGPRVVWPIRISALALLVILVLLLRNRRSNPLP